MLDGKGDGKGRPSRGGLMSSVGGGNGGKKRPYALLLILALGAAVLSVVILQKMRERRVFGIMLQERDAQLLSLQLLLEKEKAANKDIRKKLDELKEKSGSLRTQRMELNNKLVEAESATNYLKVMQQELETALVDKENQIKLLQEKTSDGSDNQVNELKQQVQQKDAEIEELKKRVSDLNVDQKTEEQPKVESTNTETKTDGNDQSQSKSGDSKEENWVTFTTNLEDQNSSEQKEGRQNLEVNGEDGNVDGKVASDDGEGAKNEVQDQQSIGNSGARKLKMFTSHGI